MLFHTLDLAARFSASSVLDLGGEVREEWCSLGMSESQVVARVTETAEQFQPDWLLIEDIPHQMRFDTVTKATARMQGRIIEALGHEWAVEHVLFIPPSLWQRGWGKESGLWRAKPEVYARFAKDQFDYEPPNLLELHSDLYEELRGDLVNEHGQKRQQVREMLKKLMTDYVDAHLIGQWARKVQVEQGTVEVKSTQRYVR